MTTRHNATPEWDLIGNAARRSSMTRGFTVPRWDAVRRNAGDTEQPRSAVGPSGEGENVRVWSRRVAGPSHANDLPA